MDNESLKCMVKSHYQGAFNIPWGETWYSNVIKSLVLSAVENDELRKENDDKFPNINDEWQPYELIIETQIGLILLLCQSYITSVISKIKKFHSDYSSLFNKELSGFSTKKQHLIKLCSKAYKDTAYTEIEALDHLANYFKHHEEWLCKPNLMKNSAKRTADAVSELGLDLHQSLWYSRNLSLAVKSLGVDNLVQLPNLLLIIDSWKEEIGKVYRDSGVFDVEKA